MNLFKRHKEQEMIVKAPVDGKVMPIEMVEDQVFSSKLMGDGIAIEPANDYVYAPISGTIVSAFPTGHAYGIMREDGLEVLIHIGIDTVSLQGKGFQSQLKQGAFVNAGDCLAKVDFSSIAQAGFSTSVMIILTNSAFQITHKTDGTIRHEEDLLMIQKIMQN